MNCPTCDGAMNFLKEGPSLYWCSRCGTLLQPPSKSWGQEISNPALPIRVREMIRIAIEKGFWKPGEMDKIAELLGIYELVGIKLG